MPTYRIRRNRGPTRSNALETTHHVHLCFTTNHQHELRNPKSPEKIFSTSCGERKGINRFRYSNSHLSLSLSLLASPPPPLTTSKQRRTQRFLQTSNLSSFVRPWWLSLLSSPSVDDPNQVESLLLSLSWRKPIMPASFSLSLSTLWSNFDSSPLIHRSNSSDGSGSIRLISTTYVYQNAPGYLSYLQVQNKICMIASRHAEYAGVVHLTKL